MLLSLLLWLLGRASVAFHHAYETLTITRKNGEKVELASLVKSVTPPCWLNPFLFNGHLQTVWTLLNYNNPPIAYKRKIFDAEDPRFAGSFAVDFLVHENVKSSPGLSEDIAYYTKQELESLGSEDDRPMLICQHGLSGGSHEIYLRLVLHALTNMKADQNWEACVVNFRGCAGSKITTDILYSARATWDIRQLVKWLRQHYPNRPLYAIGFSIGANILTNYVGEEGERCVLRAAVSISNPYNLEIVDHGLRSSWIGKHVYTTTLGAAMRQVLENHKSILSKSKRFDYDRVMRTKFLYEFDREVQCPTWGYPTEGAYYRDASSVDALLAVRIPFYGLHAEDDPVRKTWPQSITSLC